MYIIPPYSLLDGSGAVSHLLKEQLSVIRPDIAPSVPNTPCQAQHEHPRHKEGFEEENNTFL